MMIISSEVEARESKMLYVIIPKSETTTIQATRMVKGEPGRHYVGLRDTFEQALERAKKIHGDIQLEAFMCVQVQFTPRGWMHCTTKMQGTVPMLHKMIYQHELEWETWHFNAVIPVEMRDANTGEVLVNVTFRECQ
jgi:hypothetical protein